MDFEDALDDLESRGIPAIPVIVGQAKLKPEYDTPLVSSGVSLILSTFCALVIDCKDRKQFTTARDLAKAAESIATTFLPEDSKTTTAIKETIESIDLAEKSQFN